MRTQRHSAVVSGVELTNKLDGAPASSRNSEHSSAAVTLPSQNWSQDFLSKVSQLKRQYITQNDT